MGRSKPALIGMAGLVICIATISMVIPWLGGRGEDEPSGYRYKCDEGHVVVFSRIPARAPSCAQCGKTLKPAHEDEGEGEGISL